MRCLKITTLLILSCAGILHAQGQQKTRITIVNQNQNPVPGASITIYSSGKREVTNANGEVQVALSGTDTIGVNVENYPTKKVPVNAGNGKIAIVINAMKGWEGTVELPWMAQSKKYSTSAVSTVNGAQLAKNPEPNSSNLLGGNLAGLIARQNSSEPGYDGSTFNIRGFSSYNSLSPLTYVDGIQRDIQQIDPLELESVTILKDNAANGTFGIRGSGRSIMAATKRGLANTNEVSFVAQQGLQYSGKSPDFLGAQQYMQLYNEGAINDGLPTKYSQAQIDAYNHPNRDQMQYPDVNWNSEILKKTTNQSRYNLMFRGGSDVFRYFVIMGYLNQGGIFKNGEINTDQLGFSNNIDFKRYNFRTNLDFQATKRLLVSLDLSGRLEDRNYPGSGTASIFNAISTYPSNEFPVRYPDGKIGGSSQFQNNPFGLVTNSGYSTEFRRNFLGTVKLKQELDMITPGLSANGAFAFDNYFYTNGGRDKTFAVYKQQPDGSYASYGTEGLLTVTPRANDQDRRTTFYANLAYQREFRKHNLAGFINYNQSYRNGGGFDFPYASQGFASRLTYVFDQRYIAEFNGSYSGSENLPEGKRFGFFPTFSAGWIVSEEAFLKDQNFINYLKIRGSFGYTGNADITGGGTQRFLYQDFYRSGSGYVFGNNPVSTGGRTQARLANPNVTWETLRQTNLGVDLHFLKEHFRLSLDVFKEKRTDILTTPVISETIGIATAPYNEGVMDNKGVDGELSYHYEKNKIGFSIGILGSWTENKLVFNNEVFRPYDYLKRTGRPTSPVFGLKAQGFYTAEEAARINNELSIAPINKTIPQPLFGTVKPGDMKFKDQNGDNLVDVYDESYLGSNLPKYFYGIRGGFRYGKLDLSFLLQGAAGGVVDLRNVSTQGFQNGGKPSTFVLDRWTSETSGNANFPRLSVVNNALNYRVSDFWTYKSDYLKLKNAEIGFSTPIRNNGKVLIRNVRFFVNGSNLLIIHRLPVKWMDPEMAAAGIGNYPRMSIINTGAQFTF
jgi:TonB-linked SusC/RagA family outer membrane protein